MRNHPGTRQKFPINSGSAIFIGILVAAIFFMFVSSLMHFLSGERKQVKHIIGKNQAEVLALSGIDWADQELRKGRWYQKPFGANVTGGGRPTYGIKELTPFGHGNGKVTVVCEDVPCAKPASNLRNMQQLWLLHHVNVFALGEFSGAQCLLYGRFIMSPEPALNDNSTEAVIYGDPQNANPGFVVVRIPTGGNNYRIKQLLVGVGETVTINKVVATLEPMGGGSAQEIELRPPAHGKVANIIKRTGDTCAPGESILLLAKKDGPGSSRTLKKMVRITRVPLIWGNLDIRNFNDRYSLTSYLTSLSEVYLMNFSSRKDLLDALGRYRPDTLPEMVDTEELLKLFPPHIQNVSTNRAENEFLTHIIRQFTVTTGKNREKARKFTRLELDHPKMDVPPALFQELQRMNLLDLRNTKPRIDGQYYEPPVFLDRFLQVLGPQFNQDTKQFIKTLSELPDASRWIEVQKDPAHASAPASFRDSGNRIDVVRPQDQAKITVEKVTKRYDFVDPKSGFSIPMEHLLNFAQKYYDDKNAVLPKEDHRNLDHLDWPLPDPPGNPPAPQGTGEWVWIPGQPGVPPGPPRWSYTGGNEIKLPFPSAGNRDFEPSGGPPDGGKRTYQVNGVAQDGGGDGDRKGGSAPDGSGDMNTDAGGAPEGSGDRNNTNGTAPETGGNRGGGPAGAPESDNSMFPKKHPAVTIPKDGTFAGTAGPAGIPPQQGSWAWTEPHPPGGSPGGAGGEGANAADGTAPGQGRSDGSGLGGQQPGGAGNVDGSGLGSDGRPGNADGSGLGADGGPGGADGFGTGADGRPGNADGFGTGADGQPGQADGQGRGSPGRPGQAGGNQAASPGGATGQPGGGAGNGRDGQGPGRTGSSASPVYTCPSCGKLHKNPSFGGGGRPGGSGGGSSTTRGGV